MDEVQEVMKLILIKLLNKRMWGGKHTEIRNLPKSLPDKYLSSRQGQKIVKKAIKELKNLEFLLSKPATGEEHVSLNPRQLKNIFEFVREE